MEDSIATNVATFIVFNNKFKNFVKQTFNSKQIVFKF